MDKALAMHEDQSSDPQDAHMPSRCGSPLRIPWKAETSKLVALNGMKLPTPKKETENSDEATRSVVLNLPTAVAL